MKNLIVVDNPKTWPLHVPGTPVIAARTYLADAHYSDLRGIRLFNLCRSYRYQSIGYYVSLLAMARGHKPLPSIATIFDMKINTAVRLASEELEELIDTSLRPIRSEKFTLSVYFGRNLAHRYEELSARLFRMFQAPMLRAEFEHEPDSRWRLASVRPIAGNDVPESHRPFVLSVADQFFAQNRMPRRAAARAQYDLAILQSPDELTAPSNKTALKKFVAAGRRQGIGVELIEKDDFARLAEFDALFIRETTAVNHHTYRFARRAAAENLVVIDDPESIIKCTNKVYLAELLARLRIPTPRTLVVHKDNVDQVVPLIGLPCILKQPDSSFSQGVVKAAHEAELSQLTAALLDKSDLIIAQEFMPTEFDWRIGVLAREPLYACRYHMVREHWQVARLQGSVARYGNVEAVALADVPEEVLRTAVRAARLIGDGLYGVDVKHIGRKAYVMEINDNPNIDAGSEDAILGDALYDRVMQVFLQRIRQRKGDGGLDGRGNGGPGAADNGHAVESGGRTAGGVREPQHAGGVREPQHAGGDAAR